VTGLITYWRTPDRARRLGKSYASQNARMFDWRADPEQPSLWMPYFTARLHAVALQATFGTTVWAYSERDDALIAKGHVGLHPAANRGRSRRSEHLHARWRLRGALAHPTDDALARVGHTRRPARSR
jgi:hypothetical protein